MKLEDEIKQKSFTSIYHRLTVNIMFTSSWLQSRHLRELKLFKLTPQQYNVLRILRGQHPVPASVGLIQERMLDKNSNASRLLDKLLLKKLIERKSSETDRRQMDVRITAEGLELLKKLDILQEQWNGELKTLTLEEAETVNALLDKMRG